MQVDEAEKRARSHEVQSSAVALVEKMPMIEMGDLYKVSKPSQEGWE